MLRSSPARAVGKQLTIKVKQRPSVFFQPSVTVLSEGDPCACDYNEVISDNYFQKAMEKISTYSERIY